MLSFTAQVPRIGRTARAELVESADAAALDFDDRAAHASADHEIDLAVVPVAPHVGLEPLTHRPPEQVRPDGALDQHHPRLRAESMGFNTLYADHLIKFLTLSMSTEFTYLSKSAKLISSLARGISRSFL